MPTFAQPSPNRSSAGLRPSVVLTPRSSSASVARIGQTSECNLSGSRKRARIGGEGPASARPSSPYRQRQHLNAQFSPCPSPPPLANTSYRLAGGLDTPTAAVSGSDYFPSHDDSDDRSFRRRWTRSVSGDGRQTFTLGGLDRQGNGRKRGWSSMESQAESWTHYMFRLAGGFAGKVWEFCNPNGFKGFTSGGGEGYAMNDGVPRKISTPQPKYPSLSRDDGMHSTPVPGEFPTDDDEFEHVSEQTPSHDEFSRPSKRLHTGQGWVMVDNCAGSRQSNSGLRTSSSTSSLRSSRVPRPIHTRPSPARRPRSSTTLRSSAVSPMTASYAGAGVSERPRNTSSASQRSPLASPRQKSVKQSPSNPDIQKYSARKERQERQADASMSRLNSQLKAMIREGQAALATKVEVDTDDPFVDEPEDEGYSEGDFDNFAMKY